VGRALALLAGVFVGLALVFGWNPEGSGPLVEGRVLGEVGEVLLVEPNRGVEVAAQVDAEGRVRVHAPSGAQRPVLEVYAPEGSAVVQSGPIDLAQEPPVRVEPLAVWQPRFELQTREDQVRFKWSSAPAQEGFPKSRLYSILITYTKQDGERSESSLRTTATELQQSLAELTNQETLPDWDPAQRDVGIELRVFDPNLRFGPKWIGARRRWTLGAAELRPADSR
jgi:hypothetical protein